MAQQGGRNPESEKELTTTSVLTQGGFSQRQTPWAPQHGHWHTASLSHQPPGGAGC